MSIPAYGPRAEYIGTGALDEYTFDFKVFSLSDLIIRVTDETFTKVFEVDGNDTTYLESVSFDSKNGGGTVTLKSDLTIDYHLTILCANDTPTQDSQFRNKSDFSLSNFEAALDALEAQIQRVAYLAQRSLRIGDDLVDAEPFDAKLQVVSTSQGIQDNVGKAVIVGPDNASLILAAQSSFLIAVQPAAVTPLDPFVGKVAFTSAFILAVYNGTSWVKALDGTTPVVF